jgi:hypothetical protein
LEKWPAARRWASHFSDIDFVTAGKRSDIPIAIAGATVRAFAQCSGESKSFCGHRPWTMKPERRGPRHSSLPGLPMQNVGDQDKDNT